MKLQSLPVVHNSELILSHIPPSITATPSNLKNDGGFITRVRAMSFLKRQRIALLKASASAPNRWKPLMFPRILWLQIKCRMTEVEGMRRSCWVMHGPAVDAACVREATRDSFLFLEVFIWL